MWLKSALEIFITAETQGNYGSLDVWGPLGHIHPNQAFGLHTMVYGIWYMVFINSLNWFSKGFLRDSLGVMPGLPLQLCTALHYGFHYGHSRTRQKETVLPKPTVH
jgi:hypothetical protein